MSESRLVNHSDRRAVVAMGAAAAAGLLLLIALWALWSGGPVSPRTVEGWAMPNAAGTAISLHESPEGGPGEGYIVAGATWRGIDDAWRDGSDIPTCVGADAGTLTHVRLGIVTVKSPAGSWDQVAWLECLE